MEAVLHAVQTWFAARNQAWTLRSKERERLFRSLPAQTSSVDMLRRECARLERGAELHGQRLVRAHSHVTIVRIERNNHPKSPVTIYAREWMYFTQMANSLAHVHGRALTHEMVWRKTDHHWRLVEDKVCGQEETCGLRQPLVRSAIRPYPLVPSSRTSVALMRHGESEFDRLRAVRYADLWWNEANPSYPQYGNDGANFVSQCLYAGGMRMSVLGSADSGGWWCQFARGKGEGVAHVSSDSVPEPSSEAWNRPGRLYEHLTYHRGAVPLSSSSDLLIGDLVFYDWTGSGKVQHVAMVTDFDAAGRPLVNAHSLDCQYRLYTMSDSLAWSDKCRYRFLRIP
ncbi:amidase domain-containing protein [Alicyclobacillus sp. SP_1]|uniref:amidase domain-containing protein n=1 Tax=Alicyclobacillus sp. SP_1 TaxID=2942475 RepID=UPI002157613E|nr:amidase domain-containing protein [Alicyclobacillus sp. SP_1]